MSILQNKIALITGAARAGGQGAIEASLFAKEGARVILTDVLDSLRLIHAGIIYSIIIERYGRE